MSDLAWILAGGFLMAAIAMIGALTTYLNPDTLQRALLPLVALAAGTLLGGALFHMVPEGSGALRPLEASIWLAAGFVTFLSLEQFLHWHRAHGVSTLAPAPVTYLILVGDGLHNFLGGLGIASTFLIDFRAGIAAWLAAVAHEIPQELGDFAVLIHGGWSRRSALRWNLVSALSFPVGAILAYTIAVHVNLATLVLFGAGNFIYIAASDLIPTIKHGDNGRRAALLFGLVIVGLGLTLLLALVFEATTP
jgi:zinc and cadmium transporter